MSKELNERVARKMGIRPDKVYRRPLDFRREDGDQAGAYEYPDLDTPEWAGRLLAMLAERGWIIQVNHEPDSLTPWSIVIEGWAKKRIDIDGEKTLPEAVLRAIDSMPEGKAADQQEGA